MSDARLLCFDMHGMRADAQMGQSREEATKDRYTVTTYGEHEAILAEIEGESAPEKIRTCIEAYGRVREVEDELETVRDEYENELDTVRERYEERLTEKDREIDRLKNEKRTILAQREENKELVEYVEQEKSLQERRIERQDAPIWKRMKWWITGR
ncbi:hypothetical protein SAMN05421858_4871 [Haladaptatus litoreus]|uniref:Uncharacterized protein n=1 Tax=Haladaptatus litoreus TaxID=553468 RepID=A0A1N7FAB2_9EURY|nr:hypothetical protein [Haladaptatus litoreus]SIR97259.1 hypothetical protein SAMN05421858_4871 [Haladaptatus litoreus]